MAQNESTSKALQLVWPDLWSGGQIIGFSALDGPAPWAQSPAARLLPGQFGVEFDLPCPVRLVLRPVWQGQIHDQLPDSHTGRAEVRIGSDRITCRWQLSPTGPTVVLDCGFEAADRFAGEVMLLDPDPTEPASCWLEISDRAVCSVSADGIATEDGAAAFWFDPPAACAVAQPSDISPPTYQALADGPAACDGPPAPLAGYFLLTPTADHPTARFAVQFGPAGQLPVLPPPSGQAPAPWHVTAEPGLPADLARTRAKAIAILRANVFTAEGNLPRRWVVPQRFSHRNFNTFHAPFLALGINEFDPELAADVLVSALAQQQANGQVPEQAWPLGQSAVSPPPLLCWGFWRLYQRQGDLRLLEPAVARLKDYVKYPLVARMLERMGHRRSQGSKFLSWGRGEGSNMDNSPRFDINEPFAAVDLTSYAVAEIDFVARIIEEVTPEHREAVHLGWMGEELAAETRSFFWRDSDSFFYDRYPDDDWVEARTIAGLIPLFAGVCSPEQAESLVRRHVTASDAFWTPFPLASLAADDARFDGNMWRGGTWPGMNLLVVHGLRRYGYQQEAAELIERTLEQVTQWYLTTGSLWEFYDPTGHRPPAALPRGRRTGALPDYAWTAAVFLRMLWEREQN